MFGAKANRSNFFADSYTVQCSNKRPTHTQEARNIFAYTNEPWCRHTFDAHVKYADAYAHFGQTRATRIFWVTYFRTALHYQKPKILNETHVENES